MEYPKIETLFDRDEKTRKVDTNRVRLPEFNIPSQWFVTEKIDGTNIRLILNGKDKTLDIRGRTDNAQLPPHLLDYLRKKFTWEIVVDAFRTMDDQTAIIFGEGYGPKIQQGGGLYSPGPAFRVFDVFIAGDHPWWLEWDSVVDIASRIGAEVAPEIGDETIPTDEIVSLVRSGFPSLVADKEGTVRHAEGVVARTRPLLLMRNGRRLMWKLKATDF